MATPFHGNSLNQLSIGKAKTFVDQVDKGIVTGKDRKSVV